MKCPSEMKRRPLNRSKYSRFVEPEAFPLSEFLGILQVSAYFDSFSRKICDKKVHESFLGEGVFIDAAEKSVNAEEEEC
eukprot:CAMPEP_0201516372 /NCGR_PEP_ID=MMETSP0161_2-20130828/7714_2 /ASSEMBLY_ACC=CAM_ASM_000251 /TAXON_ID=180227 /ORGANISM="Neoparamoeba aestuarina, Strain SoJaBio B1-5/56/2" /LENGTH=78 /DNA_ID=CAMNT_0047913475 /DNA_START=518 /DNA_END=751 /DNA_ORIENTATION=-